LASEESIGIDEDVYEDVVIENYGIPVVITDVLVRKQKSMGRNIYINHPDSILKIERKNTVAATAKRA
jgi:Mor family transcriptional regulator